MATEYNIKHNIDMRITDNYEHWAIGVTDDTVQMAKDYENPAFWYEFEADTDEESRNVVRHFTKMGMRAGKEHSGEGKYVYIFKHGQKVQPWRLKMRPQESKPVPEPATKKFLNFNNIILILATIIFIGYMVLISVTGMWSIGHWINIAIIAIGICLFIAVPRLAHWIDKRYLGERDYSVFDLIASEVEGVESAEEADKKRARNMSVFHGSQFIIKRKLKDKKDTICVLDGGMNPIFYPKHWHYTHEYKEMLSWKKTRTTQILLEGVDGSYLGGISESVGWDTVWKIPIPVRVWQVMDANNDYGGSIREKISTRTSTNYVLTAHDDVVATIKGKWKKPDYKVLSTDKQIIAQVYRAKGMSRDSYLVDILHSDDDPFPFFIVSYIIVLDHIKEFHFTWGGRKWWQKAPS